MWSLTDLLLSSTSPTHFSREQSSSGTPSHLTYSPTESPCHSPYLRPSLRHSSPQSGPLWCKWPDMFLSALYLFYCTLSYMHLSLLSFFICFSKLLHSFWCNLHPLVYLLSRFLFCTYSPAFILPQPECTQIYEFSRNQTETETMLAGEIVNPRLTTFWPLDIS